jgi:NAD(P)-dependent dehydrogenase (short-subunit alcohol dehydrogenase family)
MSESNPESASGGPSLVDQRVVVVGGTSGMGLGAVHAASARGAEVVVASRRVAKAEGVLGSPSPEATQAVVDITDERSVIALFDRCGELDHLLVTASPGSTGQFLDQDVAAAQRYMNGKFFGSWACARYAAPRMRPGGSITFLSGGLAVRPESGASMVTAAFGAVEALSRALAVELAPIRVNTIRPGFIDSPMWDFLDEEERERMREDRRRNSPARRVGEPADIGAAAAFLMTSPYITGTVLEVNGGEALV